MICNQISEKCYVLISYIDPSTKRSLLMLTGGNDAVVKTWRLLENRIDFKMKFVGHGSDITCVKFPRNITTFLASTSLDKTARIWQTVFKTYYIKC